jgi:hypothetical protein
LIYPPQNSIQKQKIKTAISLLFFFFLVLLLSAQPRTARVRQYEKIEVDSQMVEVPEDTTKYSDYKPDKKFAIYFGLLQGGGSLVGVDVEYLFADHFGIQAGVGLVGFGFAFNYHFKKDIKSSGISLIYWHQGIGDTFAQSVAGVTYVFRGRRWFTFQAGLGIPLETGPGLPADYVVPQLMLMYSIGGYIAF